jgi:tRNA(Arg) A34 adenosine deaminase TadA
VIKPSEEFMFEAIRQAKLARDDGDYAIGAVIVKGKEILVACSSRSKRGDSPIAHAEIIAITEACSLSNSRHIPNCILYTTHEPCPMCASVAVFSMLKGIVYGAFIDDMRKHRIKSEGSNYLWRTIDISCEEVIEASTENIELVKGFMREECVKLFHN